MVKIVLALPRQEHGPPIAAATDLTQRVQFAFVAFNGLGLLLAAATLSLSSSAHSAVRYCRRRWSHRGIAAADDDGRVATLSRQKGILQAADIREVDDVALLLLEHQQAIRRFRRPASSLREPSLDGSF